MKNYAMKMCSVKRLERTELEMPVAAADQVVVKIEYCGICGSDMHFFQNGAIGTRKAPPDFILGHESAGTVIEVGKDVTVPFGVIGVMPWSLVFLAENASTANLENTIFARMYISWQQRNRLQTVL